MIYDPNQLISKTPTLTAAASKLFQPCYPTNSWHNCNESKSKFEIAFKVVNQLIANKIVNLKTIEDFVKTINEIAEII